MLRGYNRHMDGWNDLRRCPICKQRVSSLDLLVRHLDRWHIGWVQDFLREQGFVAPASYPIRKFRVAIAALLITEAAPETVH